jgi:hypothetical protein
VDTPRIRAVHIYIYIIICIEDEAIVAAALGDAAYPEVILEDL